MGSTGLRLLGLRCVRFFFYLCLALQGETITGTSVSSRAGSHQIDFVSFLTLHWSGTRRPSRGAKGLDNQHLQVLFVRPDSREST
ncbi:hypothetical protein F5X96DRAFT_622993 [Biscogniauxia mediterranea]|nr:hypothetical protein F5X96DRAFT_622993 [Biscogniauxia mediterranea]